MSYKKRGNGVVRLSDGAYIPADSGNTDWRAYLEWLALGNQPLPERTLEEARERKLNALTAARSAALSSLVVEWDGDQWDANEETSNRIANALSMIREAEAQNIPAPGSIAWRTADNQTRVLTLPALTAMGAAVFGAQQQVWARNALRKDAVLAATTVEDVEAVEW